VNNRTKERKERRKEEGIKPMRMKLVMDWSALAS
jgi:hypothetical protein